MKDDRKFSLYMHTAPNGKVYIGITSTDPIVRWRKGEAYKNNGHFYNAIQKYGWESISHEVLATNLTKTAACTLEIMLIQAHDSTDPAHGYNHSIGGEVSGLGVKRTEEQKRHLSELKKGVSTGKQSEETKLKRSLSLKKAYAEGRRTPRKFTEEEMEKAHKAHIGLKYNMTEQGREAKRQANAKHKGKPRNRKYVTPKTAKPIAQMLYGEVIHVYGSLNQVYKSGFKSKRIAECLKGEKLYANGYQWEYI